MNTREKNVIQMTGQLNRQRLHNLIINADDLVIYDNPDRFYQTYRLSNWYIPGLINTLTHHNLSLKSVLVAVESAQFQLLMVNNEALLNGKYGISARLIYLMIQYYNRQYAKWSSRHEDKIVKRQWQSDINRYYQDSNYHQKVNQKVNDFKNPKLPF